MWSTSYHRYQTFGSFFSKNINENIIYHNLLEKYSVTLILQYVDPLCDYIYQSKPPLKYSFPSV